MTTKNFRLSTGLGGYPVQNISGSCPPLIFGEYSPHQQTGRQLTRRWRGPESLDFLRKIAVDLETGCPTRRAGHTAPHGCLCKDRAGYGKRGNAHSGNRLRVFFLLAHANSLRLCTARASSVRRTERCCPTSKKPRIRQECGACLTPRLSRFVFPVLFPTGSDAVCAIHLQSA